MRNKFLIKGEVFEDERGRMRFANTFNMEGIVRFYEIAPKNKNVIRAWQGHQYERKWFHCLSGSFVINLIELDNFTDPGDHLVPIRIEISASRPEILAVPGGFATGFKASSEDARLQVFSDVSLEDSKNDDIRFPLEKWAATW